jgi:hypothetical protein
MSVALTTTHENGYFRRSIRAFCETVTRGVRCGWMLYNVVE